MFYATIWSLLPPVVAIALALITKEVYSSLFLGIVVGAALVAGFAPVKTLDVIINDGFIAGVADAWNVGIFLFLILLGILVALMNRAGGSAAFARWAEKHVHTRAGAMLATVLLGVLIFVDDYFNCLTVGSVMRPVADGHRISRAKLAYLIDATAAPVCMIAPISSWAAAVSGIVDESVMSGTELFARAIPWNYYSLFTLVFVVGASLMQFDYGPMKLHEMNARLNGDLFTSGERRSEADIVTFAEGTGRRSCASDYSRAHCRASPACCMSADSSPAHRLPRPRRNGRLRRTALGHAHRARVHRDLLHLPRSFELPRKPAECTRAAFIAMVHRCHPHIRRNAQEHDRHARRGGIRVGRDAGGASWNLYNLLPAISPCRLRPCVLHRHAWGTFGIDPDRDGRISADSQLSSSAFSACLAGAVMGDHCSPISIRRSWPPPVRSATISTTSPRRSLTFSPSPAISFVSYVIAGFVQNVYICSPSASRSPVATLLCCAPQRPAAGQ